MKLSNLFPQETKSPIQENAEKNFTKRMLNNEGRYPTNKSQITPDYDSVFKERLKNTIKSIEGKNTIDKVTSTVSSLNKLLIDVNIFNKK